MFPLFFRKNTLRARGESNRAPPGSDPPTSRGPNHYANPALEPTSSAASYAQEIQALGEQCASIVVRPEKRDFLKFSTPDILKRHFPVVFRGKTHSARGGNRTGYRPVRTRLRAAGPTTMLIPPRSPAFSAASYAQEIQALGEQCASIVVRPEKHDFLKLSTPNILKRHFFVVLRGKTHSARGGNRNGKCYAAHGNTTLLWKS